MKRLLCAAFLYDLYDLQLLAGRRWLGILTALWGLQWRNDKLLREDGLQEEGWVEVERM